MLGNELKVKATTWGEWTGMDMAKRQSRQRVVHYFATSEIEMNAKISSRNNAVDYSVPAVDYVEWENIFVMTYSDAYRAMVRECQEKETQRRALFVR